MMILFCVVLSGCATPQALPPEEVLQRAAYASQKLDAVSFESTLKVERRESTASVSARGGFERRGESFLIAFTGSDSAVVASGYSGTIVRLTPGEMFLRVSGDIRSFAKLFSLPLSSVTKGWIVLPEGSGSTSIAPDPSFLHEQTSLVKVTHDHGLIRTEDGYAYRYEVEIDRERFGAFITDASLQQARGELLIDAETFHLLHVRWLLDDANTFGSPAQILLQIDFRHFNDVQQLPWPSDLPKSQT